MTSSMFVCDVIYHGSQLVSGAQSATSLGSLVETIAKTNTANINSNNKKSTKGGDKCQLQCDDEKFVLCFGGKKDEGFESDCESSGSSNDDPLCPNTEIKVIKDHVILLDKLIQEEISTSPKFSSTCDSSTSSLGSGTESSDEESTGGNVSPLSGNVSTSSENDSSLSGNESSLGGNGNGSGSSNTEIQNDTTIKPQHQLCENPIPSPDSSSDVELFSSNPGGEYFLVSDILFCHVSVVHPRLVAVIVKRPGKTKVRGHVFECTSDSAAKSLYSHYYTASNKYKLGRLRNSKRKIYGLDNLEVAKEHTDPYFNSNSLDRNTRSQLIDKISNICNDISSALDNIKSDNVDKNDTSAFQRGYVNRSLKSCSLTNSLSRPKTAFNAGNNVKVIQIKESIDPSVPSQHTDEHGVTHIEIESEPVSLASNSTATSDYSSIISVSTPDAGDLIAAIGGLPSNLPTRSDLYQSSRPTHVGSTSSISSNNTANQGSGGREILVAGEKDRKSRQRQPPLLLRRDDDKDTSFSELPKIVDEIPKNQKNIRSRRERFDEYKPIKTDKLRPFIESVNISHDPEFRKPYMDTATWSHSNREISKVRDHRVRESRERPRRSHNKGPAPPPPPRRHPNNPSLLLVPTKSGQEPTKSLYPKESHIIRGNKIVRTEYPTFLGWTVGTDGRYAYYGNSHWFGPHEYHAARPREPTINPEVRRRSRSKSPARRPVGYKYIDAMSSFNISEKLKDLSDAVFQTKRNIVNSINPNNNTNGVSSHLNGTRTHHRTYSTISAPPNCEETGTLKSVIKKNKKNDLNSDRRVTFSAYATVQVMQSS